MFIICLFFMPETLYDRPFDVETETITDEDETFKQSSIRGQRFIAPRMTLKTYLNRLWLIDLERPPSRQMKLSDFVIKPFSMLKYPSVIFPALY